MQIIRASPGREHGVDHQNEAAGEIRRQLRIILRGHGRQLVALEPDVAHSRGRNQLEDGVQHAEPGAKDGDDDDTAADTASGRRSERRFDRR
jgi:hypothetical protein